MTNDKNPRSGTLGRETEQGSDSAGNLPARINRYGAARARAESMIDHLHPLGESEAARAAQKLTDCGNYLHFRHYYTVDKVRLHMAHFCKQHLICPLCAIRRGAKVLKAYLDRFQIIQKNHPGLVPYLVTATVKNGDDLHERMAHLKDSWRYLLCRRSKPRTRSVAKDWQGGFYSFELTNKGNGWHPHVHAIVLAPAGISTEKMQQRLSNEWHMITGDSYIVDVSRKSQQDDTELFLEVCKYALKFSDLSLSDNWFAAQALKGQRMIGSFGAFRGVEVPEELLDEVLDDLPFVDLFYRYLHGKGYCFDPSGPPAFRADRGLRSEIAEGA